MRTKGSVKRQRGILLLVAVMLLTGCARSDALWGVVDKLCVVNYQQKRDPAPCRQVYMAQGKERGFSVIQNPRYPYHFILVPTAPLAGIESAQLLAPGQTDYFGYAWTMRNFLKSQFTAPVPDDMLGMALNSAYGRSQNQLHIHLTCLREDVRRQLLAERPYISAQWRPLPDKLLKHTYYARRVIQPTAMGIYPIPLIAQQFHLTPSDLSYYGVALIPTTFDGQAGFIILTTRKDLDPGNRASVESLLDKRCELLTGQATSGVSASS
ncbi:CDP-diacylglycerol pyrophosphatase [Enterobacillus tribolii]|uniref:CDP-diacylglycerol pyrophosphatase n=1 Tax=Enterobacillus tribolii TaxID=1487935 RepID=A0A370QS91_9GAMM|nr:CDP-diacylglycerol diphosphatase [Enterobacillus tribolii]RDK92127.1 CDP-diacylglycerol pyrophosphatase [Enterobacillus tribolii]